jgi:hypothetical protein
VILLRRTTAELLGSAFPVMAVVDPAIMAVHPLPARG